MIEGRRVSFGDERDMILGEQSIWHWRGHTAWQLFSFIVPAMSISLADASMSFVDTICIARFGSTLELAALGPNTVIFNFSSYVFFCVGLAINTLVGRFLREGRPEEASRVVSQALMFGCVAGTLVFGFITAVGPELIAACGTAPEVVDSALSYLRIRACAVPVVICINAAQSGLMAQQNSVRPSIATLSAAAVNVALDVFFIRNLGMGVAGAALATVIGQICTLVFLLPPYLHRDAQVRLVNILPNMKHAKQLGLVLGPIFVTICAKNICYMLIQSSATILKVVLVAAHQVVWSVWAMAAFCCSPMEQAALAFIPAAKSDFEKRELTCMVLLGGFMIGITGALVSSLPPLLFPHVFTPDSRLWIPMKSVAPQAFLSMTLAGVDVAMNGILLAEGQAKYLARAMVINLSVTSFYFFVRGRSGALPDVWWGLVLFFFMRTVQGMWRLVQLTQAAARAATLQAKSA